MRKRDLLCALGLLLWGGLAPAQDCLPWQNGSKPVGAAADEAARKYLRDAVRRHPSDSEAHARLGEILFSTQCYDLALSELLRARRLGADNSEFLLRLASVENILGAFPDAAADADAAAAMPGASEGQRASGAALAGLAFASMNQEDLAIARLRRSLELAPQLENSALMLADLLARRGLNVEAAAALETFVARTSASAETWARLAGLQLAIGRPARAHACWTKVRGLNPAYPMIDSMDAQAMLADKNPNLSAVLRLLDRAKQTTPPDPDVFFFEGKTLVAMSRFTEAAEAFESAVRLQPLQPNFHYQLGMVYRNLGRAEEARRQFAAVSHLRGR